VIVAHAVWIGALVGCALKLVSPHRSGGSWIFAALVGALGGVVGIFTARLFGFGREEARATLIAAALGAATVVVIWAIASRLFVPAGRRRRATRPTIAF
jgi:uncharacterized membrane protein YeaQ/YmgE (transglycosylase-associated protein family)